MTYWDNTRDSNIKFWSVELYKSYYNIANQINEDGYRGDRLQSSEVVYLGTCDVMSSIQDGSLRWVELLHKQRHNDQPLIALGSVASGVPSMIRRLYSYIKEYGPPRYLYMTIPRFDSYEFVNKSGKCYCVSSRLGSAKFCRKTDLIDDEELNVWLMQLSANKSLTNIHNMRYMLEERFAFIETLCKAYNIELKWTFNPSDASVILLNRYIEIFKDISAFMQKSFVGLPLVKDHLFDRTIGIETHKEIYSKFLNEEPWDYSIMYERALANYLWSKERYGDEPIKMEDRY